MNKDEREDLKNLLDLLSAVANSGADSSYTAGVKYAHGELAEVLAKYTPKPVPVDQPNPLGYTHYVIETYRDGGVWKHGFYDVVTARRNMGAMKRANKGRSYELVEL